jgi:hypothetical protein
MKSGNFEQGIEPHDWFGDHFFVAALTLLESGTPLGRLRDDNKAVRIAPPSLPPSTPPNSAGRGSPAAPRGPR